MIWEVGSKICQLPELLKPLIYDTVQKYGINKNTYDNHNNNDTTTTTTTNNNNNNNNNNGFIGNSSRE